MEMAIWWHTSLYVIVKYRLIECSHVGELSILEHVPFSFNWFGFVPKTRQPPPLSAGVRCCDDKRSCKPASFPNNRKTTNVRTRASAVTLSISDLFLFFPPFLSFSPRCSYFTFFPLRKTGCLSPLRIFANALSRCAGGTTLTLVFSTRLHSRSFFSSPRNTNVSWSFSYVFTIFIRNLLPYYRCTTALFVALGTFFRI